MVFTIAKKKKDSIKISFIDSPSSEDVTGSLIFISTPNHKFIVDAGLYQTNDRYEDFLVNNRKYKEFKPKELDYVFITHNHGDHCLLLPKLFKDGCKANVIIADGSAEVLKDMAEDCAEINERDVLIINNQHDKHYESLYDLNDVHNMTNHTVGFPMEEKIKIDDELSLFTVSKTNKFYSPANNALYGENGKDNFRHEQNLIISENQVVLIMGCGHTGVVNIMEEAEKYKPDFCVGGFHLFNPLTKKTVSKELLNGIVTELQKYKDTEFYTCHCTGKKAFDYLSHQMSNMHYMSCGESVEI